MRKYIFDFFRRGIAACGLGPIVLAIIYLVLRHWAGMETLTVNQVCTGIFSLSALAFIAGGTNVVYQIERLPLMAAILIHGGVLYISYLCAYLINGWLESGITPILVFTGIFIIGYLVIWAVIYYITRKNTAKLNEALKQNRQTAGSK